MKCLCLEGFFESLGFKVQGSRVGFVGFMVLATRGALRNRVLVLDFIAHILQGLRVESVIETLYGG